MYINGIIALVGKYAEKRSDRTLRLVFVTDRVTRDVRYTARVGGIFFGVGDGLSVVGQIFPYGLLENIGVLPDRKFIIRVRGTIIV